jgi:carboxymethylenebutenolidase
MGLKDKGVNVYALDLYDGKVADNPDDAGKYMQAVKEERLNAIINGALNYVGEDTEVATIGWCFGGGWSLRASILAGEQGAGCVMYYGMPVMEAEKLAPLEVDVLGIFASQDKWITPEVVDKFVNVMNAINKPIEVKQFNADHAFANPSGDRYKEEAAQEANKMAMSFLQEHL